MKKISAYKKEIKFKFDFTDLNWQISKTEMVLNDKGIKTHISIYEKNIIIVDYNNFFKEIEIQEIFDLIISFNLKKYGDYQLIYNDLNYFLEKKQIEKNLIILNNNNIKNNNKI